jgi:hypothetical protein
VKAISLAVVMSRLNWTWPGVQCATNWIIVFRNLNEEHGKKILACLLYLVERAWVLGPRLDRKSL